MSTTTLVEEKDNLGCLVITEANSAKGLEAWRDIDQVAIIEAQEATLQAPHIVFLSCVRSNEIVTPSGVSSIEADRRSRINTKRLSSCCKHWPVGVPGQLLDRQRRVFAAEQLT